MPKCVCMPPYAFHVSLPFLKKMNTKKALMNTKRIQTLCLSAALLIWPSGVDQKALGGWISPSNTDPGEKIAFFVKIASLLAGGVLSAIYIVGPKKLAPWRLWTLRI